MRRTLRAVGLFLAAAALNGCAQDKYNMRPKFPEEYQLPPNERRYNEPDTAGYRRQAAPAKEEKTALGRPGMSANGPGGF